MSPSPSPSLGLQLLLGLTIVLLLLTWCCSIANGASTNEEKEQQLISEHKQKSSSRTKSSSTNTTSNKHASTSFKQQTTEANDKPLSRSGDKLANDVDIKSKTGKSLPPSSEELESESTKARQLNTIDSYLVNYERSGLLNAEQSKSINISSNNEKQQQQQQLDEDSPNKLQDSSLKGLLDSSSKARSHSKETSARNYNAGGSYYSPQPPPPPRPAYGPRSPQASSSYPAAAAPSYVAPAASSGYSNYGKGYANRAPPQPQTAYSYPPPPPPPPHAAQAPSARPASYAKINGAGYGSYRIKPTYKPHFGLPAQALSSAKYPNYKSPSSQLATGSYQKSPQAETPYKTNAPILRLRRPKYKHVHNKNNSHDNKNSPDKDCCCGTDSPGSKEAIKTFRVPVPVVADQVENLASIKTHKIPVPIVSDISIEEPIKTFRVPVPVVVEPEESLVPTKTHKVPVPIVSDPLIEEHIKTYKVPVPVVADTEETKKVPVLADETTSLEDIFNVASVGVKKPSSAVVAFDDDIKVVDGKGDKIELEHKGIEHVTGEEKGSDSSLGHGLGKLVKDNGFGYGMQLLGELDKFKEDSTATASAFIDSNLKKPAKSIGSLVADPVESLILKATEKQLIGADPYKSDENYAKASSTVKPSSAVAINGDVKVDGVAAKLELGKGIENLVDEEKGHGLALGHGLGKFVKDTGIGGGIQLSVELDKLKKMNAPTAIVDSTLQKPVKIVEEAVPVVTDTFDNLVPIKTNKVPPPKTYDPSSEKPVKTISVPVSVVADPAENLISEATEKVPVIAAIPAKIISTVKPSAILAVKDDLKVDGIGAKVELGKGIQNIVSEEKGSDPSKHGNPLGRLVKDSGLSDGIQLSGEIDKFKEDKSETAIINTNPRKPSRIVRAPSPVIADKVENLVPIKTNTVPEIAAIPAKVISTVKPSAIVAVTDDLKVDGIGAKVGLGKGIQNIVSEEKGSDPSKHGQPLDRLVKESGLSDGIQLSGEIDKFKEDKSETAIINANPRKPAISVQEKPSVESKIVNKVEDPKKVIEIVPDPTKPSQQQFPGIKIAGDVDANLPTVHDLSLGDGLGKFVKDTGLGAGAQLSVDPDQLKQISAPTAIVDSTLQKPVEIVEEAVPVVTDTLDNLVPIKTNTVPKIAAIPAKIISTVKPSAILAVTDDLKVDGIGAKVGLGKGIQNIVSEEKGSDPSKHGQPLDRLMKESGLSDGIQLSGEIGKFKEDKEGILVLDKTPKVPVIADPHKIVEPIPPRASSTVRPSAVAIDGDVKVDGVAAKLGLGKGIENLVDEGHDLSLGDGLGKFVKDTGLGAGAQLSVDPDQLKQISAPTAIVDSTLQKPVEIVEGAVPVVTDTLDNLVPIKTNTVPEIAAIPAKVISTVKPSAIVAVKDDLKVDGIGAKVGLGKGIQNIVSEEKGSDPSKHGQPLDRLMKESGLSDGIQLSGEIGKFKEDKEGILVSDKTPKVPVIADPPIQSKASSSIKPSNGHPSVEVLAPINATEDLVKDQVQPVEPIIDVQEEPAVENKTVNKVEDPEKVIKIVPDPTKPPQQQVPGFKIAGEVDVNLPKWLGGGKTIGTSLELPKAFDILGQNKDNNKKGSNDPIKSLLDLTDLDDAFAKGLQEAETAALSGNDEIKKLANRLRSIIDGLGKKKDEILKGLQIGGLQAGRKLN